MTRQTSTAGQQAYVICSTVMDCDSLDSIVVPLLRDKLTVMGVAAGPRNLPRFRVLSVHHRFKLRGCGPTGGANLTVYKVMPRADRPKWTAPVGGGTAVVHELPDEMGVASQTAQNSQATAPLTQVGWTPFDMPLITARYKIKTLWNGILLPGEEKDLPLNQYYRGGGCMINPMTYQDVLTAGSAPVSQTFMKRCYKPYYILVRIHGVIGGDSATAPATIGHSAAAFSAEEQLVYNVSYSPVQSELDWTGTAEGTANYTTQVPISTANTANLWP